MNNNTLRLRSGLNQDGNKCVWGCELWNVGACASQVRQVRVEYFYIVIHHANVFKAG